MATTKEAIIALKKQKLQPTKVGTQPLQPEIIIPEKQPIAVELKTPVREKINANASAKDITQSEVDQTEIQKTIDEKKAIANVNEYNKVTEKQASEATPEEIKKNINSMVWIGIAVGVLIYFNR